MGCNDHRGTSLIRNTPLPGHYSRTIPRVTCGPRGGGCFLGSRYLLGCAQELRGVEVRAAPLSWIQGACTRLLAQQAQLDWAVQARADLMCEARRGRRVITMINRPCCFRSAINAPIALDTGKHGRCRGGGAVVTFLAAHKNCEASRFGQLHSLCHTLLSVQVLGSMILL